MVKKILIGLACVLAVLAVVIATRPDSFRVERSATINAPQAVVFDQVSDFHRWVEWSPWEKLDPAMQKTFSGPPAGAGAIYAWAGNKDVGEGRMTIVSAKPPERIDIKLEFLKPFPSTSDTSFTISPEGAGSKVSWAMEGKNNFVAKAFTIFMNMDSMIGKDFEKGLAQLRERAEAEARRRAEAARAAAPPPAPTPAPAP